MKIRMYQILIVIACVYLMFDGITGFISQLPGFLASYITQYIFIGFIPLVALYVLEVFLGAAILLKLFKDKSKRSNILHKTLLGIILPFAAASAILNIYYIYERLSFYHRYRNALPLMALLDDKFVLTERILNTLLFIIIILLAINAFRKLKIHKNLIAIILGAFFSARYLADIFEKPSFTFDLPILCSGLFLNISLFVLCYYGFSDRPEKGPTLLAKERPLGE